MKITSSPTAFIASCGCGWRTTSQTKRVVMARVAEHRATCEEAE